MSFPSHLLQHLGEKHLYVLVVTGCNSTSLQDSSCLYTKISRKRIPVLTCFQLRLLFLELLMYFSFTLSPLSVQENTSCPCFLEGKKQSSVPH